MLLKRKRSDSEISSSSSLLASPLSANLMSMDGFQRTEISTPSLFSSRTRKRHRDNRPSESDIHQHTLSLLYSAQQNPQRESQAPLPSQSPQTVDPMPSSSQSVQQSTLHSFWRIPSRRPSSPLSNFSTSSANTPFTALEVNSFFHPTNCEDCEAPINQTDKGDSMDVDNQMDIDMEDGNHACNSCGKHVCHNCVVINLGADKKCVNCAGKKQVWVGGIGWMDQD